MQHKPLDRIIRKKFNISPHLNKIPKIIEVYWLPPHHQWVKLNTDGLSKGNSGVAAIGGIFRNFKGYVLGCYSQNIGHKSSFDAEMQAFITGVEFTKNKGWNIVWFELDSKAIIDCIMNPNYSPPRSLATQWFNCKAILSQMRFYCSHTYREANAAADLLSNIGLSYPRLQWWDSHPPALSQIISHDISLLPYYRFS